MSESKFKMGKFHDLRASMKRANRLFIDPDFPPNNSSLYFKKPPGFKVVWKRAKELCEDPQLLVDGASRLDIQQGSLGDCWVLAAFGSLLSSPLNLIARVIPDDQGFGDDYAGIFHFQFWRFGTWTDVIVDDYLPTYMNRLCYTHSAEKNEFWCPLLEKAYAKLHGSYEALVGGKASEAMEDLTGGITEKFGNLSSCDQDELWKTLVKANKKHSLMGCSIKSSRGEQKAAGGLIMGHAYSVTAIETLSDGTRLVRIRNPWGTVEWTGGWSDTSTRWNRFPEDKERLFNKSDDGEFWMSMQDFCRNWTSLEITHLGPGGSTEAFNEAMYPGVWRRNVSAGGCLNFRDTHYINPQYKFTVEVDDDDADGVGTVVVSLIQAHRRKQKHKGLRSLQIGFAIYKAEEGAVGKLSKTYFKYNKHVALSNDFGNARSNNKTLTLEPGKYVLVPSTFRAHDEGNFCCRIFTEKEMTETEELDEEDAYDADVEPPAAPEEEEADAEETLQNTFDEIAGEEGEIDAYELRDNFLNPTFKKAMKEETYEDCSLETARSILAIGDTSESGKLDFDEFQVVLKALKKWMAVFKQFDADGNGYFEAIELREALKSAGFSLSDKVYRIVGTRYAGKSSKIRMDDFIQLALKLEKMFAVFKETALPNGKQCKMFLQKFLVTAMNS